MRVSRQGLFMLCICLCLSVPVYAAGPALSLDAEAGANGNVSAALHLSGVDALSGLQFTIAYESEKLALSETKEGGLPEEGYYMINGATPGLVHVLWFDPDGRALPLGDGETALLSLSFAAKESGHAEIALRTDEDAILLFMGENEQTIRPDTAQSRDSVEIRAAGGAAPTDAPAVTEAAEKTIDPLYILLASPTPAPQARATPLSALQEAFVQPTATPEGTPAVSAAEKFTPGPAAAVAQVETPAPTQTPYEVPTPAFSDEAALTKESKPPPELEVIHSDKEGGSSFPMWLLLLFLVCIAAALCVWFCFIKRNGREE